MDKVDRQSVDLGHELWELVQLALVDAPVVLVPPVRNQLFQVTQLDPVVPAGFDLARKAGAGQPFLEIAEYTVIHGDLERPNRCRVGSIRGDARQWRDCAEHKYQRMA